MRGARGLLISISGGPDLTLYEVDEAATRIREEVDPEANIILGATFDDSLEGTMRVSVVATGLRLEGEEELGHNDMDDETIVIAKPVDAPKMVHPAPMATRPMVQPVEQPMMEAAPKMQPVAPRVSTQRMPSVDEFPAIAQKQIAAQQSRIEDIAEHATKRKMGIFERLATVGLGRKDEVQAAVQAASRRAEPKIAQQPRQQRPQPQPEPEQNYEDDQLAIPAFLRRQASN
jgi:cell division protein FtsZ